MSTPVKPKARIEFELESRAPTEVSFDLASTATTPSTVRNEPCRSPPGTFVAKPNDEPVYTGMPEYKIDEVLKVVMQSVKRLSKSNVEAVKRGLLLFFLVVPRSVAPPAPAVRRPRHEDPFVDDSAEAGVHMEAEKAVRESLHHFYAAPLSRLYDELFQGWVDLGYIGRETLTRPDVVKSIDVIKGARVAEMVQAREDDVPGLVAMEVAASERAWREEMVELSRSFSDLL